jgi:hypothetical protein
MIGTFFPKDETGAEVSFSCHLSSVSASKNGTHVDALCEAFSPHGDILSSPGDDWWEKTGEHLPFPLTVGNLGEHAMVRIKE